MDVVYAAGSLPVTADDRETKLMAARLHLFGFVAVEEIEPNGTARLMRPSETIHASTTRPWRISRPAFGRNGRIGLAEAGGTLLKA